MQKYESELEVFVLASSLWLKILSRIGQQIPYFGTRRKLKSSPFNKPLLAHWHTPFLST